MLPPELHFLSQVALLVLLRRPLPLPLHQTHQKQDYDFLFRDASPSVTKCRLYDHGS